MLQKLKELWWRIDAWFIMREVNADPLARDAEAPEGMYEKFVEKIKKERKLR